VDNINGDIYFGRRNVSIITNELDVAYIFTNTISLKLNARHYWSQPQYSRYWLLADDGALLGTGYNTSHDLNFNSFNLFTSFVWQFLPGSEMSAVYQNSIYTSGTEIISNYFADAGYLFKGPQSNSISIKIIYYLEYQHIRQMFKNGS
jgi:hypothetical protein